MRKIALALLLGLGGLTGGSPAAAAPLSPWSVDSCTTTVIEAVFRLDDDTKGRRYLLRLRDAARNFPGSGTVRLDTRTAHVVAPFDGSAVIVRAPLDDDVVAAAIASAGDRPCPLRPLTAPAVDADERSVIPHTPTRDAVPVRDAPLTCEHPFVEASADHSVVTDAPIMARQQGISGIVVISVQVDAKGTPTNATVVSSPSPILNQAALAAAKSMTYTPGVYRCAPDPQGQALFRIHFLVPRRP